MDDYVPYWDFDDPKKEVRSAGAIAASGLLFDLAGRKNSGVLQ